MKWRRAIGRGYSAPVVAPGALVLFHRIGDQEQVERLDPATGDVRWTHASPTCFKCRFEYSDGPYSTPVIDDEHVYTWGAEGQFRCLRLADGAVRWQRQLSQEFDVPQPLFAVGSSPLLWRDRLILNVGGRRGKSGIVALDKATGETLWTATEHGASYATPRAATMHGRPLVFVLSREGLVSLAPQTGDVHWEIPFRSKLPEAINATSPLVHGDLVVVSAYTLGSLCVRVLPDGGYREVWRNRRTLDSHYNTLTCVDGHVFGFSARDRAASLRCIDLASGQLRWKLTSELGRGMLLAVDGHLLLLGEYGHLASMPVDLKRGVLKAITSEAVMAAPCYTAPVLCRGLLYVRNEQNLACFDLRRHVEPPEGSSQLVTRSSLPQ